MHFRGRTKEKADGSIGISRTDTSKNQMLRKGTLFAGKVPFCVRTKGNFCYNHK